MKFPKSILWYGLLLFSLVIVSGCGISIDLFDDPDGYAPMRPGRGPGGMTWGSGSFDSAGEQIYFTGLNAEGERIRYRGGPDTGMMMRGYLSCASCHGPDGRGGEHLMHMEVMDAPDIRWDALASEEADEHGHDEEEGHGSYDLETFRQAVVMGQHPNGEPLSDDMPRWQMTDDELRELMAYLQSLD